MLAQAAGADDVFHYTLRSGETLSDVARIFGVSVPDLMSVNRIAHADRLATGQQIVVPNAFALEAAQLRTERAELLDARREAEQNATRLEQTLAAARLDVQRLEREREAMADALAATVRWRFVATLLGLFSLVALASAFIARAERASLAGRLRRTHAELAALGTAKQRYREALAQLELRYQHLYTSGRSVTREVAEGARRLAWTFQQGAERIERGWAELRAEREREEHRHAAGRNALRWIFATAFRSRPTV
jgi:LysM repeat protein